MKYSKKLYCPTLIPTPKKYGMALHLYPTTSNPESDPETTLRRYISDHRHLTDKAIARTMGVSVDKVRELSSEVNHA